MNPLMIPALKLGTKTMSSIKQMASASTKLDIEKILLVGFDNFIRRIWRRILI